MVTFRRFKSVQVPMCRRKMRPFPKHRDQTRETLLQQQPLTLVITVALDGTSAILTMGKKALQPSKSRMNPMLIRLEV
jgi:hypothetical protein